ncbi:hypothetical protein MXD81_07585 [Microbacteriaceae bacterium K1510]|nr:hypothetical protein [Microbacteriaceae bacterium K1510]
MAGNMRCKGYDRWFRTTMTPRNTRILPSRLSSASSVIICSAFSAFVLLLCVAAGMHFKSLIEQEFYRQTENVAQVLLADFEDDVSAADAILLRVAADIPKDAVSQAHEHELHLLLSGYTPQPSMIGPAILDRNGTLIASANTDTVPSMSLKDRNTFRIHADSPNENILYIGTPMRSAMIDEWIIQFSRPLRDDTGAFYGVVIISYRLSHFVRLYEKLKLSDRGFAALAGKDGVVRIRSFNGDIGHGDEVPRVAVSYSRIMAGESMGTFYTRTGPDDVLRIGTFVSSQMTPFYVTVAYDDDYLRARYIGFFYALALCWLALTAGIVAAAYFIQRLETVKRQAQLEIVNSAVAERQNISADMHDSIGASLAALLASLATRNIQVADVRRKVGEVLTELRFLVDSAEPIDGDIGLLLGNVRHRMGGGLELAGIAFDWQVGDVPPIEGLTARDALAIRLVMMEALSNVLHHSKATVAKLTALYDRDKSSILISVCDNGRGFDEATTSAGRGLSNMRKRAATISTGATIEIDSGPGRGTTVRLALKVPRSASK